MIHQDFVLKIQSVLAIDDKNYLNPLGAPFKFDIHGYEKLKIIVDWLYVTTDGTHFRI